MEYGATNGIADMSLSLESPITRKIFILMTFDVNFALLTIAGYGFYINNNPFSFFLSNPALIVLASIFPLSFYLAELYNVQRKWWKPSSVIRVLVATLATIFPFGVLSLFYHGSPELHSLLFVMTASMAAEVLLVRSFSWASRKRKLNSRSAIVIGAGWGGRLVIDTIFREPRLGMKVAGIIDDNSQKRNFSYKGIKVLGNRNRLEESVEKLNVSIIILAISYAQNAELIKTLLNLKMRGIEIIDMPQFYEKVTGKIPIKHIENFWFIYSGGFDILRRPILQKVKRLVDIMISLAGLLLSFPLMALVALFIKMESRGPVFFKQERVGQNEVPFSLIKFRSMKEDAEEESGPVWASPDDYRVTRIGRWLRVTRLDEIPQFLNVLKGDMSFIGPRPERPYFVAKLKESIPYYSFRFAVKPGLSGWAQVNYHYGSSTEDAVEKLKYDLYYIKNMSFWLDLLITIKTCKVVLFAHGT